MTFTGIVWDCPWHEPGGHNRGADDRYATMDRAEILATILRCPVYEPAENCHGYMWTTMTSLLDGIWVLDGLGFRYVTHSVWIKTRADDLATIGEPQPDMGLGQYFRGAHELVLFGVRGKGFAVRSEDRTIPSWFAAPVPRERDGEGRKIHSRKPQKFFEMVDRRTVGPKLSMFERVARGEQWTAWGDQAPAAEAGPA
jgi:N6-adenosine-specific RNA methylase IME4